MGERGSSRAGRQRFCQIYGPWALIAGASEGLGAAFARALARRGMNILLIARRSLPLDSLADECRGRFGVEVHTLEADLASPDIVERLGPLVSRRDLGLVVYNAAFAPLGDFASLDSADLLRVVDVNVRAPVAMLRSLLPPMLKRGRGGAILMSSLAGLQGSPRLAAYAASKAFNRVLAEGLWLELKRGGVDVLACCAGAIRTPGFAKAAGSGALGAMEPETVAERALRALGRGPVLVPGLVNKLAAFAMTRLLPQRAAIAVMAASTAILSGAGGGAST